MSCVEIISGIKYITYAKLFCLDANESLKILKRQNHPVTLLNLSVI